MPRQTYADKPQFVTEKAKKSVVLAEWLPTKTRSGKRRYVAAEVQPAIKDRSSSPEKRMCTISPTKPSVPTGSGSGSTPATDLIWSQGDLDAYEGFQPTRTSNKSVRLLLVSL